MYVIRPQLLHLFDILHIYLLEESKNSENADAGAGDRT
jgi:hypothetical protein